MHRLNQNMTSFINDSCNTLNVLARKIAPQNNFDEIEENTTLDLNFEEIRPDTINKTVLSNDLCKLSFKIFTHDKEVEILYNPIRNMFNATALANNSVISVVEGENKVGVDPPSLKDLMKTIKFIRFVDRISYLSLNVLFLRYYS